MERLVKKTKSKTSKKSREELYSAWKQSGGNDKLCAPSHTTPSFDDL